MIDITGKYTSAKIMTDNVESEAISQVLEICNTSIFENANIACMPDIHAGKGSTIGFTCKMKDYIVPNIVGVDISCSVTAFCLGRGLDIDFEKLDNVIRKQVPSGTTVRSRSSKLISEQLKILIKQACLDIGDTEKQYSRHLDSIGTLGGGNHFISIEKDNDDYYLLIHSGSRNFGKRVCDFHQQKAIKLSENDRRAFYSETLKNIPEEDRQKFIESQQNQKIKTELAYLTGNDLRLYATHANICSMFAEQSHEIMCYEICSGMGWNYTDKIQTKHNYIEFLEDEFIIRKGAVRANSGESFVLPMNMKDGSYICRGFGNNDWNYSAPHGAGRLMSRSRAKSELDLGEFENSMQGIYSTSIGRNTLDEAPLAYKEVDEILKYLPETAEVITHLTPVYNFKAS